MYTKICPIHTLRLVRQGHAQGKGGMCILLKVGVRRCNPLLSRAQTSALSWSASAVEDAAAAAEVGTEAQAQSGIAGMCPGLSARGQYSAACVCLCACVCVFVCICACPRLPLSGKK